MRQPRRERAGGDGVAHCRAGQRGLALVDTDVRANFFLEPVQLFLLVIFDQGNQWRTSSTSRFGCLKWLFSLRVLKGTLSADIFESICRFCGKFL